MGNCSLKEKGKIFLRAWIYVVHMSVHHRARVAERFSSKAEAETTTIHWVKDVYVSRSEID